MDDHQTRFANRTIKAMSDELLRPLSGDVIDTFHTEAAIDQLSDIGLERVHAWLDSMTRHHPLTGPLFVAHRLLIEAVRDDINNAITRRGGTSE